MNHFQLIQKFISIFLLSLVLMGLALNVSAAVIQSSDYVVFKVQSPSGTTESRAVTFTNKGNDSQSFDAGAFLYGDGLGYSVATNACENITLISGQSCEISFTFDALDKGGRLAKFGFTINSANYAVWLGNALGESKADEVNRRIPPVVEKIRIFALDGAGSEQLVDGTNDISVDGIVVPGDRLISGQDYRIYWYAASYDAVTQLGVAFFDCGVTAATACADYFSENFQISSLASGTLLSTGESTTLALPSYSFSGVQASNMAFSHDFNIDGLGLTEAHQMVLRFYQRSSDDAERGSSAISALIPNGLNILEQGDAAYLGVNGRKVMLPIADQ